MTTNHTHLPNREALQHFDNKALRASFSHYDLFAHEHALAFTVAKMMHEDLLTETHRALQSALANGTGFRAFQKTLKPYLMAQGWWGETVMTDPKTGAQKRVQLGSDRRLQTIYRTNMRTAFAAGKWQRIQATKDALPYLKYLPSRAEHKRDAHKPYYNLIRPVDDPIWQKIYPPNGYGCSCSVRQLTRGHAEREGGVSPPFTLEEEEFKNPRTGEVVKTPVGIHPSFAHNHDRLTAMRKLYADKLKSWEHVPEDEKPRKLKDFHARLNRYMLDLVHQPDFQSLTPTVLGHGFTKRFTELFEAVKNAGGNRGNSLELQKQLSRGESWVVATLSPEIQSALQTKTALIRLSDQSLIKEIAHHGEIERSALLSMFRDTHNLLKHAEAIEQVADNKVIYFYSGERFYEAVVKAVGDSELYLVSLFEMKVKQYEKERQRILGQRLRFEREKSQ